MSISSVMKMGDLLNLVNLCGRNLNCSLVHCCPCLFFLAKNTDVKLLGILCNLRLVICYLIPLSLELFITIYLNYMLLCLKKHTLKCTCAHLCTSQQFGCFQAIFTCNILFYCLLFYFISFLFTFYLIFLFVLFLFCPLFLFFYYYFLCMYVCFIFIFLSPSPLTTTVAKFLDTSVCGGSWCLDPSLSPFLEKFT